MEKLKTFGRLATILIAFSRTECISPGQAQDVVLVGAGDIAPCDTFKMTGALATATLLDSIAGTVFAAGDLAYANGADSDFARCYEPTWGRHRARTTPAVGNHEYTIPKAAGYFNYFGPAAGAPTKGYYSYDLGAWHVVVLNSECSKVGGCTSISPQGQWLNADLAAHPASCTLAIWHRPLYSSTSGAASSSMKPLWKILYDAGAELAVNGHAHNYERFAPQDQNGNFDTDKGIREFIVGTGGASFQSFSTPVANSEVRNSDTFGVLKLTLHPTGSYDWEFVPQGGKTFTDSGSGNCH